MKVYALYGVNDLRMEEREVPTPQPGQVLVQVRAAGICGSDIPRIFQTGTYSFPTVPGHEFSGTVAAVGAGVSPEWEGCRVGVFPLIPCMQCPPCRQKHYVYFHFSSFRISQNLSAICTRQFLQCTLIPI